MNIYFVIYIIVISILYIAQVLNLYKKEVKEDFGWSIRGRINRMMGKYRAKLFKKMKAIMAKKLKAQKKRLIIYIKRKMKPIFEKKCVNSCNYIRVAKCKSMIEPHLPYIRDNICRTCVNTCEKNCRKTVPMESVCKTICLPVKRSCESIVGSKQTAPTICKLVHNICTKEKGRMCKNLSKKLF